MAKPLQPDRSQVNIRLPEGVKERAELLRLKIEHDLGFVPSLADLFAMGVTALEKQYGIHGETEFRDFIMRREELKAKQKVDKQ